MDNHQERVNVLLFANFESLDVFGPVEILGRSGYDLHFCSLTGGEIESSKNALVHTVPLTEINQGMCYLFLVAKELELWFPIPNSSIN